MTWEHNEIVFTSITSYREYEVFREQDIDFTSADILRPQDAVALGDPAGAPALGNCVLELHAGKQDLPRLRAVADSLPFRREGGTAGPRGVFRSPA